MKRRTLLGGLAALAWSAAACTAVPPLNPSARDAVTDVAAQAGAAQATPITTLAAQLPNRGLAPELTNEIWINSPPVRLADLRGQVVIVEFWTYG